ncbi:MAG: hypothetical protein JWN13_6404 [Betaproteobacteria bacterium]|nr:hypothetical protein [Betaproteobacteria bacterium]
MMPGVPRPAPLAEVPLLGNQPPMPPDQGIRRNEGIELQQRFTAHRLRLPRKRRPLNIGEPYALASEALLQQPILGLEELNQNELTTMHPTRDDHQQEYEQRWHGTHARSLPRDVVRI